MAVLQTNHFLLQTGLFFIILPHLNLGLSDFKICGDPECESKSNQLLQFFMTTQFPHDLLTVIYHCKTRTGKFFVVFLVVADLPSKFAFLCFNLHVYFKIF